MTVECPHFVFTQSMLRHDDVPVVARLGIGTSGKDGSIRKRVHRVACRSPEVDTNVHCAGSLKEVVLIEASPVLVITTNRILRIPWRPRCVLACQVQHDWIRWQLHDRSKHERRPWDGFGILHDEENSLRGRSIRDRTSVPRDKTPVLRFSALVNPIVSKSRLGFISRPHSRCFPPTRAAGRHTNEPHGYASPSLLPTRCRICESACGLLALVEDDVVTALRPDPDHPVSLGYACRKGPAFLHVQNSPHRVTRPRVRKDGVLSSTSWDEALKHIGGRLAAIRSKHGPESVGLYLGNASGHSLGAVLGGIALQEAMGTTKAYSALTLDNSEMFVVLEQVMGNPTRTFLADYAQSDFVLLLGTDPMASQPSQAQSRPGALSDLLVRAQADQLVVVDPRRSETAKRASTHLRPRPGGDVALLAWLLRCVLESPEHRSRAESDALLTPDDLHTVAQAVSPFDRSRAASATGLTVEELDALVTRLLRAKQPLVWSGLGVLLGPDGTLGYWLTLSLQAALGGIDALGGYLQQPGAVDLAKLTARLGVKGSDPGTRSRIGGFPAVLGTVAAATMAEDILTPGDDALRALVVLGGNPAVSLPDTPKALAALAALDLLVCVDLFVNDTGALADAVLPAATWLERDEVDLHTGPQRIGANMAIDRAVVPPREESRTDWEIMLGIARAAGWRSFGSAIADIGLRLTGIGPLGIARAGALFSPISWRRMARSPRGLDIQRPALGTLRSRGTDHGDRRMRLAVPQFLTALTERIGFTEAPPAVKGSLSLQLVTSVRPVETMNSWMHETPQARRRVPRARMHPLDLLLIGSPSHLRLERIGDADVGVRAEVVEDDGVRQGVVVLPFGWGHHEDALGAGPDGPRGVNANVLVGTDRLEPFTGQPLSNGQWVRVRASREPDL